METKKCAKCGQVKSLDAFGKWNKARDGLKTRCKVCRRAESKKYRTENRESCLEYGRWYASTHKEERSLYAIEHKEERDAAKRKYVLANPERRKEQGRRSYAKNKHKRRVYEEENRDVLQDKRRKYMKESPQARIAHNHRSIMGRELKKVGDKGGNGRLYSLWGCDRVFFIDHIQSQWTVGMTWDNYGRGIGKWSIDHIAPLIMFDLRDEEQRRKAFHYTNCRPMWYEDNAAKGGVYEGVDYRKKKKLK